MIKKNLMIIALIIYSQLSAEINYNWLRTYGGSSSEGAKDLLVDQDSFITAGYTYSEGNGYADALLLKTDSEGNTLWSKSFGGTGFDYANGLCQSQEGDGYLFTGYTTSQGAGGRDIYLVKTDKNGQLIWSKTFGGEKSDIGEKIITTSDNNYLICGTTESYSKGEEDIYLLKIDLNGDTLWTKTFGCEKSDMAQQVIETSDGNYLIIGSTGLLDVPDPDPYLGKNREIYLLKTDSNGNFIADMTYNVIGSDQGDYDMGYAVCEVKNGYILTGCSSQEIGGASEKMDISIVKTDFDLNEVWKRRLEISDNFYDFGYSICKVKNTDNEVVITGNYKNRSSLKNDLFILKYDSEGNQLLKETYQGIGSDNAFVVKSTGSNSFILAGQTNSSGNGKFDLMLMKIDQLVGVKENPGIKQSIYLKQNYPNPFNPTTNISFYVRNKGTVEINIFNEKGELLKNILNTEIKEGEYSCNFDGSKFSSGTYFYSLKQGNDIMFRKMILMK